MTLTRARPLLGTIVSIRANASELAVSAAFAAIERVHALMNAHSESGDVAAINREAHLRPVQIHPWTYEVLACARTVSEASDGAFDVAFGGERHRHTDMILLPGCRVQFLRRSRVDLGGIAKGFAVDRAVDDLRRFGATSGSVNAGGDLRIFGDLPQTVRVRLPSNPQLSVPLVAEHEGAYATSATYFGSRLRDARTGQGVGADSSITVSARSCMLSDALTKVVAAQGPRSQSLMRFGARAFLVDRNGKLYADRG